jgi:hypothetical protein
MKTYRRRFRSVVDRITKIDSITAQIDELKILTAKILIRDLKKAGTLDHPFDAEFKVFSQFGDDGIIQYLITAIDIPHQVFIEFGVENYKESNTRFLLVNNNWRGLVIDGSEFHIQSIRDSDLYWKHELTAACRFVTKDNINGIFTENGFTGEIGILSIDIDGNDYWIWESINTVRPIIVIVEYNSVFGSHHAITIPYDPEFNRTKASFLNLYWGTSLKALCTLAEKKGYHFVGCNSNGNNAYFVRKDKIGTLKPLTVSEGYRESKYRESRDLDGNLTYLTGAGRLRAIEDMPVIDVERGREIKIRDLIGS